MLTGKWPPHPGQTDMTKRHSPRNSDDNHLSSHHMYQTTVPLPCTRFRHPARSSWQNDYAWKHSAKVSSPNPCWHPGGYSPACNHKPGQDYHLPDHTIPPNVPIPTFLPRYTSEERSDRENWTSVWNYNWISAYSTFPAPVPPESPPQKHPSTPKSALYRKYPDHTNPPQKSLHRPT